MKPKPWTDAQATMEILAHAEASKPSTTRFIESIAFWMALIIAIAGNLIISVIMVPFLLLLKGIGLYFTIFIVGGAFGLLFNVLIGYIEKLGQGQHIIAGAFIPALAVINIWLITKLSNQLELLLALPTPAHNPITTSLTYVIAFTLPYIIKHFQHVRNKRL